MDGSQDLKAVGWIQAMVGGGGESRSEDCWLSQAAVGGGWESGSEKCGLESGCCGWWVGVKAVSWSQTVVGGG